MDFIYSEITFYENMNFRIKNIKKSYSKKGKYGLFGAEVQIFLLLDIQVYKIKKFDHFWQENSNHLVPEKFLEIFRLKNDSCLRLLNMNFGA